MSCTIQRWRIMSKTNGPAGNDVTFQDRLIHNFATGAIVLNEGRAITRADCSTLTCTVYKQVGGTWSSLGVVPVVILANISDTLVDDELWLPNDEIGRNFLHTVPGSFFAVSGLYWVTYELVLALTGSPKVVWAHQHEVLDLNPLP